MSLEDELDLDRQLTRTELREKKRRRKMRRRRTTTIVVVGLLVLGGGGFIAFQTAGGVVTEVFGDRGDYEGTGDSELVVEILPGSSTTQIANQLVELDVIKGSRPFIKAVEREDAVINAGSYTMKTHMSSEAAVDALVNPAENQKVAVPEGLRMDQIRTRMVDAGLDEAEVDAALDDKKPADYGLDVDAPNLEGYLYPATYQVEPGSSATDMVQKMVDRTADEITELGIDEKDVNELFTLASMVEVEAPGDAENRAKVARVFRNRLGPDSETDGYLQSDATVAYIFGANEDLTTTKEQRATDDPYNTYKNPGLPPGPINSPSPGSIEAAQNPAEGDWQYFVTVNPDTGETKYADTYSEHEKNVEEYQKWLRENGDEK